jgi:rhamnose transport system permease protein
MSTVTDAGVAVPVRTRVRRQWLRPERVKELSLVGVLLVAFAVFSLVVDDYLSARFFSRLLIAISITAVLAAGEAIVIITRNIDLSIGAIVGVSAYLTSEYLADHHGLPAVLAVTMAVSIGVVLGVVNGVLVAVANVPSIIVTLGTLSIFRSLLVNHAGGQTIATGDLPQWIVDMPRSTVFTIGGYEVRTMFVLALAIIVVLQLVLQYTRSGRHLYAVGSNPEAARQAGLHAKRVQVRAFTVAGGLAGFAGFLFVARFGTINVTAGSGLELAAIAAAVVGGVSTLGGSGTVLGAFLGAVLIAVLDQSLVRVEQISEFWRDAILGALIVLAVLLDVALGRRFRAKAREDIVSEAGGTTDG